MVRDIFHIMRPHYKRSSGSAASQEIVPASYIEVTLIRYN